MKDNRQVFQTESRWRWRAFQWTGALVFTGLLLMVPVIFITLSREVLPRFPLMVSGIHTGKHVFKPVVPRSLTASELSKYKGFDHYLLARQQVTKMAAVRHPADSQVIRAAFYVDWDPQSFYSLQQNISHLNMVVPEWFFIDPSADTLRVDIDLNALKLMKAENVRIVPLINNINDKKGTGEFDGSIVHRIMRDPVKMKRLMDEIVACIAKYQLQGINIDFEELAETGDEQIVAFQRQLYERLHPLGLLVTQDIPSGNPDFNIRQLSLYNDFIFLMAYDEHYSTSVPGAISSQNWVEKALDETAAAIPSGKIILCFAGYGYDWPEAAEATTLTYAQALANASLYKSTIHFDNNNYNNFYSYQDADSVQHKVCFADAATNFNIIRFADEYGIAGTALWRLGSEDERLWTFYGRKLDDQSLSEKPFDFTALQTLESPVRRPDYVGDGEVLSVISEPRKGQIRLERDSIEQLISEEEYLQIPTQYVIKKYGNVNKQVLLTFDDGPDPKCTPEILDILKKENVPAAFFIIGMQAENNLPLLKRIYREGHEIGNHTFTHPNIAAVSLQRAGMEMEATRLLIEAVTGRSTVLFRAPYNADAEPSTEAELKPVALSRQKNYYTVGESIDPEDWQPGITADSIYNRTIRQYENNPEKGIILFHDAGGDRQATVDALPKVIEYFRKRGVAFITIASLLHTNKDVLMPPVKGKLINLDGEIFGMGYWFGKFLMGAFWLAIVLGLVRVTMMAIMAIIQKVKTKSNKSAVAGRTVDLTPVSIIVPAYNEEVNAVKTIQNLLQQDYPAVNIIFVDDGSTDQTYKNVLAAFEGNRRVTILTKPNGGKASALNFGISKTDCGFVVCIDADTQLHANAVTALMQKFHSPQSNDDVGAVAGYVRVGNENNLITRWQSIEYITAQNFDRLALGLVNGISVVPGAIGAFRKEAITAAGGFTTDTLAEDCDLTIRILRQGYRVVNCADAIAVTEAPETVRDFMKQRFRWSYGIMQSFWKNRDACFNPKYKGLGMISLPNILVFQIVLPMLAPLADLMLIIGLVWNRGDAGSLQKMGIFYLVFMLIDVLVSLLAFLFEGEKPGKLIWLIPQRFVYRQMMYVILFKAIRKAIKGESQGWGVLKRTGNVENVITSSATAAGTPVLVPPQE